MQDVISMLHSLRRPTLLMRAARIGSEDYRRDMHLPRLLGYGVMPRHAAALLRLIDLESDVNALRIAGDSSYSLVRHVDLLIAMLGEARILRASQTSQST
mgnify:CR=1 FL=1